MIADKLQQIQGRILNACKRSLRSVHSVKLIAVSKGHSLEKIREAHDAGQRMFGENYPQEASKKQKSLAKEEIEWHFIGRLQTNKIKEVYGKFKIIHSVDRLELLEKLLTFSEKSKETQTILLQVNVAGEESKAGFQLKEIEKAIRMIGAQKKLILAGFMTMPPLENKAAQNKTHFAALKKLTVDMKAFVKAPHTMEHLSMGSSHDFETAIEEGATFIRVGTDIFGERKKET